MPAPGTLVACFMVSMACGTLYVYSAYAPQLSARLKLGAVEMSRVVIAGNMAMSFSGPIAGRVVDRFGFKAPICVSFVLNWAGYTLIRLCYESEISSQGLLALALLMIGAGATFAFSATVKCAALNYPTRRGVATAIAMAGYGISAFAFSSLAALGLAHTTSGFLSMLSFAPAVILVIFGPLVALGERGMHSHSSTSLEDEEGFSPEPSLELRRLRIPSNGAGISTCENSPSLLDSPSVLMPNSYASEALADAEAGTMVAQAGRTRPIAQFGGALTTATDTSTGSNTGTPRQGAKPAQAISGQDVYGIELLKLPLCWYYAIMLGCLAGMGQSYIYSCGYIVRALVEDDKERQSWQASQVSWLSVANCVGRILSGFASDFTKYKLNMSRSYVLLVSISLAALSQIMAWNLTRIEAMPILSVSTGLFYGSCFGLYPGIVSDAFGLENFSSNWGIIALSPVPVSYYLTLRNGKLYDQHSTDKHCFGPQCYQSAYGLTLFLALSLLAVLFVTLKTERRSVNPHMHAN